MRILVTGSRNYTDAQALTVAIVRAAADAIVDGDTGDITVVQGGARGADRLAADAAHSLGLALETFEADWKQYGRRAGMLRNQAMVDAGADLLLAFPLPGSVGTYDCIRRARTAGIPVIVEPMHAAEAREALQRAYDRS